MPDNQTWMLLLLVFSAVGGPLFVLMCAFILNSMNKKVEKVVDLILIHEGQIRAAHAEIKGLKSDVNRIEGRLNSSMHDSRCGDAIRST